jgi:diguanylate cyclase (GGDEF)-like protein
MSKVVDHLAELTGLRDRDLLDTTLAGALRDLLAPRQVTILRAVGADNDRRWLLRAQLGEDDVAATSDTVWGDYEELLPLDAEPLRLRCLAQQEVVAVDGAPALTLFPLFGDRDVAGVVELRTEAALSSAEMRLVSSMLRVYRNFESVLDYSERDTLTGLLNRKTFDEGFYKSTARLPESAAGDGRRRDPGRARLPYLAVVDIDHFKQVNDVWGHLIGDEVLLLMSRLMRACFRFHDLLYRFGGEEFVVLLRCGGDDDAIKAFERLRNAVQAYAFPQVGHITVSVGFTEVRPGDSPSAAFERADQAVYWAKKNGRNRVSGFADLVVKGELNDESKAGDVELF